MKRTSLLQHSRTIRVVPAGKNYLNDIVLDFTADTEEVFAYMSDPDLPAVYVYSMMSDSSWRAYHPTMGADPSASTIEILGEQFSVAGGINGIALTHMGADEAQHNGHRLFYSALQGFDLFSVSVSALRNSEIAGDPQASPQKNIISV
jgi:hypothetical protein